MLWLSRRQVLAVATGIAAALLLALAAVVRGGATGHLTVAGPDTVEGLVGETARAVIDLANEGNGPLRVDAVALAPAAGSGFALPEEGTTCSQIAAGATCAVTVLFHPVAAGPHRATLNVRVGDRTHPVALHGVAFDGPQLAFAGDDGQFGVLTSATVPEPRVVTVANTGDRPVTDLTTAVEGEAARAYRMMSSCGAELLPGDECSIVIHFTGGSATRHEARLVVEGSGSRHELTLVTVVVAGADLEVVMTPAGFEPQLVGTTSPHGAVVVSNSGDAPLEVASILVRGPGRDAFALTDAGNCVMVLAPADECRFSIAFAPTTRGPITAELVIVTESGETVATLTGDGIVTGFIVFDQFDGDFGVVSVGAAGDADVVLRNAGDTEVEGLRTDTTGDGFQVVSSSCGPVLAPSDTCAVVVRFDPGLPGMHDGALVITPRDRLALTATAVLGEAEFAPVGPSDFALYDFGIDFGEVAVGDESAQLTITVTNIGDGMLEIAGLGLSPVDHFRIVGDSCTATALAPGGRCHLALVFVPALAGDKTAFLDVAYSVGTGPERGYLTGSGLSET